MTAPSAPTSSWLSPPAGSSRSRRRRAAGQRPRELHPLEGGERQAGGGMVRDRAQVEERQQLLRVRAALGLLARDPAELERVGEEVAARAAVRADHHVLEHGLGREQREVLEGAADAQAGDAVRRHGQERRAVEGDRARGRRVEPAHAVEERGLPGAVRSDEPHDLARLDVEGHAVEGDDAAESHRDVLHAEDGHRRLSSAFGEGLVSETAEKYMRTPSFREASDSGPARRGDRGVSAAFGKGYTVVSTGRPAPGYPLLANVNDLADPGHGHSPCSRAWVERQSRPCSSLPCFRSVSSPGGASLTDPRTLVPSFARRAPCRTGRILRIARKPLPTST